MANNWDNLWGWATRDSQGDPNLVGQGANWLGNVGQNAYSWAGDNPLQALSLGVGAVGTGMGIWDAYQASQRLRERQRLAEQMMRMGPSAYAPNFSDQYLQERYFRPASQFMAQRGQFDGGAYQRALADAAVAAEGDRIAQGNQIFQSRLGALGYGPVQGPSGNTGALGQALNNIMLQRAMANRYQQPTQPSATMNPAGVNYGSGPGAEQGYAQGWDQMQLGPIPDMQLQGGMGPSWGAGMSLTDPLANWTPQSGMGTGGPLVPELSQAASYYPYEAF